MAILSSPVLSSDLATNSQFNNLRTDAITHTHDGTDVPVITTLGSGTVAGSPTLSGAPTISGLLTALAGLALTGTLTLATAISRLVPGATSFAIRNNANNADNLLITDAGAATVRAGLTVTAGGLTVTAGATKLAGSYTAPVAYSPGAGGTATIDLSLGDIAHVTMPAGNITIAITNAQAGQCFLIRILQDSVGSRTVTWFTTIKWAGGVAPTLTTGANKADTVGFEVTALGSPNTYDGGVVFANV